MKSQNEIFDKNSFETLAGNLLSRHSHFIYLTLILHPIHLIELTLISFFYKKKVIIWNINICQEIHFTLYTKQISLAKKKIRKY